MTTAGKSCVFNKDYDDEEKKIKQTFTPINEVSLTSVLSILSNEYLCTRK